MNKNPRWAILSQWGIRFPLLNCSCSQVLKSPLLWAFSCQQQISCYFGLTEINEIKCCLLNILKMFIFKIYKYICTYIWQGIKNATVMIIQVLRIFVFFLGDSYLLLFKTVSSVPETWGYKSLITKNF